MEDIEIEDKFYGSKIVNRYGFGQAFGVSLCVANQDSLIMEISEDSYMQYFSEIFNEELSDKPCQTDRTQQQSNDNINQHINQDQGNSLYLIKEGSVKIVKQMKKDILIKKLILKEYKKQYNIIKQNQQLFSQNISSDNSIQNIKKESHQLQQQQLMGKIQNLIELISKVQSNIELDELQQKMNQSNLQKEVTLQSQQTEKQPDLKIDQGFRKDQIYFDRQKTQAPTCNTVINSFDTFEDNKFITQISSPRQKNQENFNNFKTEENRNHICYQKKYDNILNSSKRKKNSKNENLSNLKQEKLNIVDKLQQIEKRRSQQFSPKYEETANQDGIDLDQKSLTEIRQKQKKHPYNIHKKQNYQYSYNFMIQKTVE
ncbi:hypothetical protein PPERSA_06782 [Pseudocohnilembus persalinus]|uniref:Uncharacterized protein n=1 Tax=Pseudocohnilembus persalinus TaxID=266149 RepID=A0A0V0QSA4_PSEPJ|nr:hypothetical protein PPERSA_06782 [Pseudocohnilembus persalinus]|eukprot:KRX05148.1 hypothetical protein PPERSA_06782 [Pseudocohnilembus persalinus]